MKNFTLIKIMFYSIYIFSVSYVQCTFTTKPNVVIVLIDNHSYFELSRNGHKIVETPRIDRLAEEGVTFKNFYAPPFCSPSRTELLTGRYALRAGVHNTIGGVSILHKNEKTIAKILKKAGYRTGVFGKWHLGNTYPYAPKYRGFDEVFIHGGGGVSQLEDYYGNSHMDATFEHNGQYVKSRGFSTDVLFDQGIDFIGRNRENPFFCFISTPAVHFPTLKHPENTKRLLARGVPDSKHLAIYSMIENVDDNVGRLLDYLDEIDLKENTLFILASDQGVNDRGAFMHRAGEFIERGVQYDEKHQVYCMIQYPQLTNKNRRLIDELAGMVDITPTILDICNVKMSESLDGLSLKPLLAGSKKWDIERKLIIQCPRKRERNKWENVSIKYQNWRFVDGKELYDVKKDRGQLVNIIKDHPDLVTKLRKSYETFWTSLEPAKELIPVHILGSIEAPAVRLNGMDWYSGDAPWHQGNLNENFHQGKWLVDIERDGHYSFELRRYPREASKAIGATSAAIQIGNPKVQTSLDPLDKKAILQMELKKGQYDLQTFFKDDSNPIEESNWGAYYVYVNYLQ